MAISGKLLADFSSFYDAVQKAEVQLKGFESGAGKVENALNRMTTGFSGQKVIQDATLMTAAIEKVGGVTALTGTELQTAGTKAQEAVEKMKRLGIDVPPGLQKIADASGEVGSGFQSMMKFLGPIGPAIAGAFSFGAIVAFGKQVFASADSLMKLSDQTGIGVVALQQLREIAAESGNSLDEVAHAVNQMQRRIAGGDDSAVAALGELNVSLASIRDQAPEQQFFAIGKAIASVQDPAERARLAIAVFGRAGAEILPTLRADLQGIADATETTSAKAILATDRLGDAWTRLKSNVNAAAGSIIGKLAEIEAPILKGMEDAKRANDLLELGLKQTADMVPLLELVKRPVLEVGAAYKWVPPTSDALIDLNFQLDIARERLNREAAEAKRAAEVHERFLESIKNLTTDAIGAAKGFGMLGQTVAVSSQTFGDVREQLGQLDASVMAFHDGISIAGDTLSTVVIPAFSTLPGIIAQNTREIDLARGATEKWTDVFKKFPDLITAAFTGGAGLSGALKGFANEISKSLFGEGGPLASMTKGLGNAVGGALSKVFGDSVGGVLGKIASSILPGLGGIIAGVGGLFGKLFSNPEKEINPIREAFVQAAGGLDQLNRRAQAAGVTLAKVLDAKNPKQYQKAIEDLNKAMEFQDSAMATLEETTKRYGFTIEELGPKFAAQQLDKQAQGLYQDFKVLTGAGIDIDTVLGKMGVSINDFVHSALKTGTEIPAALAPVLQRMVELGQLTDENGNIITDLDKAGIHFSETMTQGFDKIVDAVAKLTDAITRGLGGAIAGIPRDIDINAHVHTWNDTPLPPGTLEMAGGGMGRVTKPTLFFSRGNEDYAFSGEGKSFGGGGSSQELAALRRILVDLPDTIARKQRDQLQKIVRAA